MTSLNDEVICSVNCLFNNMDQNKPTVNLSIVYRVYNMRSCLPELLLGAEVSVEQELHSQLQAGLRHGLIRLMLQLCLCTCGGEKRKTTTTAISHHIKNKSIKKEGIYSEGKKSTHTVESYRVDGGQ